MRPSSLTDRQVRLETLLAWTCLMASIACGRPGSVDSPQAHLVERTHMSMGSEIRVAAWTADETGTDAACREVFAEFDRLDTMMSVWRAGSDIVRLNAAAGDHAVPVSPEVREVLHVARQVSEWTGGRFDVTFGALSGLWKFDHDQDDVVPDRRAVLKQLPLVNYRNLEVDDEAGSAFLTKKGMRVHLGGIGKGYAVERSLKLMKRRGFHDFMIQAGGDLYVAGRRGDRPWRVGIRDPRGPADQIFAALDLTDGTFSTSGDYERFFMKEGRRYHHILDPAVGEPATASRSVTIMAESPTLADALSKGVFIAGPQVGMALIEGLPHVEGVVVSARNEVFVSRGLRGRLMMLAPPTDAP